jgi:hypothetical protein
MSNQNESSAPEPAPVPASEPGQESAWLNPQGPRDVGQVLDDLRDIMQVAGQQYEGELRMDTSHEVSNTVRLAQASILWQERLATQVQLKFDLQHEHLPMITGQILWVTEQFLCLADDRFEYLVNLDCVVMVSGLPSVGVAVTPTSLTPHMDSIWLNNVLEDQQVASWYSASNHVLIGLCTRLGLDAIDVQTDQLSVTVMRKHLVAVRIPLHE